MSDQIIQVAEPASPTKNLDSEQVVVGVNTVQRERIEIAGAAAAEIAWVKNTTPASTGYGLIVRPFLPTDGTNIVSLKAANTAPTTGDTSLVVGISPQSPLPAGTATIGVVNAGTGTWAVSGTVTANAGTGTFAVDDVKLELAQASTTLGQTGPLVQAAATSGAPAYTNATTNPLSLTLAGALRVDGSAVTQPVNGTVTSNQGTAAAASGKWPIEIVDSGGVNIAAVTAANAVKVDGSAVTQPVSVAAAIDISDRVARLIGSVRNYTADTTYTYGTVTAPAAGGVIVTTTPGAGTFEIRVLPYYGATSDVGDNMQLKVGATVIGTLFVSPLPNSSANGLTPVVQVFPRLTVAAATAVTVNAISAGAAGAIYIASITLTKITA